MQYFEIKFHLKVSGGNPRYWVPDMLMWFLSKKEDFFNLKVTEVTDQKEINEIEDSPTVDPQA